MEIEKLKIEYIEFLLTDGGKQWLNHWQNEIGSDDGGSFGDFLYDFYPEMLPFVIRGFLGEDIIDSDKMFCHGGLLAKFIEIPKINI